MPELPEVEVLVRRLAPLLKNKTVRAVEVRRPKVIAPASPRRFARALAGAKFLSVARRGKFLLFTLRRPRARPPLLLAGHLGMTGRMYLLPTRAQVPPHAAVVLWRGKTKFVYEDRRYFGRLSLDATAVRRLGPEPLGEEFTLADFSARLKRSAQPIKVKLLDQSLLAGVGNIYASEALFCARVSPRARAKRLSAEQVRRLWRAIRAVLQEAIDFGSTVPLDWNGTGARDGLFYYGRAANARDSYEERLRVYDRRGKPCLRCGTAIERIVQSARSTFYCPQCQRDGRAESV